MKNKLHFFLIFILFKINILSAQKNHHYAGHFTDRASNIDLIIRDNGETYEVDLIKDGGYSGGHGVAADGILQGNFINEKDTTPFMIVYQEGDLVFTSEGYKLSMNKADDNQLEVPTSYDYIEKVAKKPLEIPFPTGNRVYSPNQQFSFNLPDSDWDFEENEGVFSLRKEDFKGFFRIIPHDISTITKARKDFKINDLYPGKIDLKSYELEYGKRGVFRSYEGYDIDNRFVKFHILTLVSLSGSGVHIITGSHSNDYKPLFEVWNKSVANSFEFSN